MASSDIVLLEVIKKEIYAIDKKMYDFYNVEKDWFENFPINKTHASRDSYKVANATSLVSVKKLSKDEWEKYKIELKKNNERITRKMKENAIWLI